MADAARILKVAQAMCARRNHQPWAKVFPEFKQHWIDAATHVYPIVEQLALEASVENKDNAYRERNRCVAFIAQMALGIGWTVGQARHPEEDKDWDDDWRNIVFIDAPCGQLSWHFHDSEWEALGLDNLPQYLDKWDGHTTEEKYKRMEYPEGGG